MVFVPVDVDTRDVQVVILDLEKPITPILHIVGEVFQTRIDRLIQTEGATGVQGSWPGFSDVTLKMHPRRRGGLLLQDTGQLASMQISTGSDWVQIGSPAPYAKYQFQGILNNPIKNLGPVPARDALAIRLGPALDEAADLVALEYASE